MVLEITEIDTTPAQFTDTIVNFFVNFGIGAAVFLLILVVYDVFRYFFPGHCYYRATVTPNPADDNYDGSPLRSPEPPSSYLLSWVLPTLNYPMEKFVETHGLDAAMFLRFLQTQARLFFVLSVYSAVVLIPTYATAKNGGNGLFDLEQASLSNVSDQSSRLWVTLASEIVVLFVVLFFLYRDLRDFTRLRVQYRKCCTNNPSNFAVLVMDIPTDDRNEAKIFDVFNKIFPGQVVQVHVVRDASKLLQLKERYISAVNRHQRAQIGASPWGSAHPAPWEDGNNLLENFSGRQHSDNTISMEDPDHSRGVITNDVDIVPSAEARSSFVSFDLSVTPPPLVHRSPVSTLAELERDAASESSQSSIQILSPDFRDFLETETGIYTPFMSEVHQARFSVKDATSNLDEFAPVTHAAFVIFNSRMTTTCAVSAPVFTSTSTWRVSRAPDPKAINWSRINISRYTTRIRSYISFSVLTVMTILWLIPSSFIQALGNLSNLSDFLEKDGIYFLGRFISSNPRLARFLESFLPPVLLFLVMLVVPQIMRFVISFERNASRVQAENKLRNFLFFFYVMSIFIYQVGFGSILRKLGDILDEPKQILSFLSTSIPSQATFLMKYVLANSFLGSVLGMLNIGRLFFRPLLLWRARTDRDRRNADRLFADYPFAKMYGLCMMIALISYVYATIAPIINCVAFLYFALAYLCTKQFLLYSHRPLFEGGGYLFRDAWTGLLIGIYTHQLSMFAILWIKSARVQAVLVCISFVFSIWFTVVCRQRFSSRVENGSLYEQTEQDEENMGLCESVPEHFIDMYVHPGLKSMRVLDGLSGNRTGMER